MRNPTNFFLERFLERFLVTFVVRLLVRLSPNFNKYKERNF